MNFFLLSMAAFVASVSSEAQTQDRFLGGLFGFGNSQCLNCQYDLTQASYCCRQNLDTRCCSFGSGVGGSGYYPGGGGGGYVPAVKPGTCPFNAGYSSGFGYNGVRYKREEAPLSTRFITGGIYNNNNDDGYYNNNNGGYGNGYSNGFGYGNGNGYNNGYQRDECYSDNDCVGRQKCCQNFRYRQCVNPLYNG